MIQQGVIAVAHTGNPSSVGRTWGFRTLLKRFISSNSNEQKEINHVDESQRCIRSLPGGRTPERVRVLRQRQQTRASAAFPERNRGRWLFFKSFWMCLDDL